MSLLRSYHRHTLVFLLLILTGSISAGANLGLIGLRTAPFDRKSAKQPPFPNLLDLVKGKGSCSSAKDTIGLSPFTSPEYDTYKLAATYYHVSGGLTTTLMLNNKGGYPIVATPTVYNMAGASFRPAPITIPAASYFEVDLHQILAGAAEDFNEGSMKIAYTGVPYQLGAQVKMVDAEHDLIWAEQFQYTTKYKSNRLENVWWLPYNNSDISVAVSNTSASTITLTITSDGTSPDQSSPTQITLAPWETKILDIMDDIVGHHGGHIHSTGGISITHAGAPGAILARMFISKANKGYSAAMNFVDPETLVAQSWSGTGLQFRELNGPQLDPVLVARNNGTQTSHVNGRVVYTDPNGSVQTRTIQQFTISAGKTKLVDLDYLTHDLPASVKYGGIELNYDTPKGTVIPILQSVSSDGNQVYQVPIIDPQNIPGSAAGFPWKADGDFHTIVYVKNESDETRKFITQLIYDGGQYSAPVREIKPHETIAVDFREFRDAQIPDGLNRVIPLSVHKGQIAWSVRGSADKKISVRSEQVSVSGGIASNYVCHDYCCPSQVVNSWLNVSSIVGSIDEGFAISGTQVLQNCSYQTMEMPLYDVSWDSMDTGIATVDSSGLARGVDVGQTYINASWHDISYLDMQAFECVPIDTLREESVPMEVINVIINVPPSVMDGATANFGVTVTGGAPTAYQWSFESPGGSGNNPHVNFTAPTAASTQADAHWFARPNSACSANFNSQYTIKLRVSFQNRGPITKEAPFTVQVGTNWGGSVNPPATSAPAGTLELAFDSGAGLWRVVGPGSLQRVPSGIVMRTPQNSQFYNKTLRHEEVHVEQYATGIFSDLYLISNVMPRLLQLTDTNKQVLEQRIFQAVQDWRAEQFQILGQRLVQAEREAYMVSDPLAPAYLFNNCGRF